MKNIFETKDKKKVSFQVVQEPGSKVFIAGTFNQWNPTQYPMRDNPDSGIYKIDLHLPPGRCEYKFIINGEWHLDPNCPDWAPNEQGSLNSLRFV